MAIRLVSSILNKIFYTLHILNNSKNYDKYYLKFMLQKNLYPYFKIKFINVMFIYGVGCMKN